MRKPLKGFLWVHIDRLDRDDGKVWAIQYWFKKTNHYMVVPSVVINAPCYSQFFGATAPQPRAVICVPGGRVRIADGVAHIDAAK